MKKIVVSALASLATCGAALAGGMTEYDGSATAYNWTGLYVGGHVGAGWGSSTFQDPSATTNLTICCELIGTIAPGGSAANATANSFLGGLHVGGHYQIGRLVIGSEAGFSWTGLKNNTVATIPTISNGAVAPAEAFGNRTDWIASFTSSLGYAQDRWLAYSKGGLVLAHDDYTLGVSGVGNAYGGSGPYSLQSTASDTRVGGTVGFGLKWALTGNWSTGVEYNYMYFPSKGTDFNGTIQFAGGGSNVPATFNTNSSQQISDVKLSLEYKF